MAGFRFRLHRVLRLREQLRRQAEDALHEARAAVARIDEAIAEARAAQDAARAAEEAGRLFAGADLLQWRAHGEAARARETRLATERVAAERVVDDRRAALLARRRDERALERLRERLQGRHDAEAEIVAGRLLDELALRARQEKIR